MALALISIVLVIFLVLIAIRFGFNRGSIEDDDVVPPVMHGSGIYSIVKKSPRENIIAHKPSKEDIIKYIADINEDIEGLPLSPADKEKIVDMWDESVDENLANIEKGDVEGIEFYYYDFQPVDCPVCTRYYSKGKFVTREEIFRYPSIIPPFHLGCTSKLLPHHGKENLRETTELGMLPLFKNQLPPKMPDWKITTKINIA